MKITDFLPEAMVIPSLESASKDAVLRELAAHLTTAHPAVDCDRLIEVLREREKLGSTAIGDGIAIPHGKLPGLTTVLGAFGRHVHGIDFQSLDGAPTRLFFLLVAPEDSAGMHLKALARVSRLLKDASFRGRLLSAADRGSLYTLIQDEDGRL